MADKINRIFTEWKDGEIHTISWFEGYEISRPLIFKYLNRGLIEKLGGGAYAKANGELNWQAGIIAAQAELKIPIHVSGRSALELLGVSHYLSLGPRPIIYIAVREKIKIPIWLRKHDWKVDFQFSVSRLINREIGLTEHKNQHSELIISTRERAILELIEKVDLSDSFEILDNYFEGLTNIRSKLTQELLENCNSIKVKRIFLFMAVKFQLPILKKLNLKKINLGSGKRVVALNGRLDKNFNITVPKSIDESSEI